MPEATGGTPIWLLDVDGVVNAFDETRPVLGDWDDWQTFTACGFPMRYSPAMTSRIRTLHETGQVEVRWLTTWGRKANTDLKPFGLPEFEVAAEQPFHERLSWWKLPVAQELFAHGNAIIWTDDDIRYSSSATNWLREVSQSRRAGDLRAYAPQGAISQEDMADIEAWVVARGN